MNNNDSTNRRSVLVLSLSGIGNFITHLPTLRALKLAHPDWHVTVWLAPRGTRILAEIEPSIDEIIEAPIKLSPISHVKMAFELARRKFDVGVVLSPGNHLKSAAYLYLAGIPMRIGSTYPLGKNRLSSFLLTNAVDEVDNLHDVEQNLRLLEPLGILESQHVSSDYSLPQLPHSAQEKAEKIIAALRLKSSATRLIGFHAGSSTNMSWKRWPIQNFATVAKGLLAKMDAHILLFGGPEEEDLKLSLHKMIENSSSIISTDLLTTAALISRCHAFLSNDSGLMHLAAATGVPTYGLFGPTDENQIGPRGNNGHAIRQLGTTPVYDTDKNFDPGPSAQDSLKALTPGQVLDSILKT